MQKIRAEKGITLIALVITIIVMLILVGVSVSVALKGGLFTTAKQARDDTATERNNEIQLSEGKVEINGELYNSIDEYVSGVSSNNPTDPENPTGYTAYSIGDEITVEGENFYVIADSNETNPNVTLLAKDCIITDENSTDYLKQSASANYIAFSETNYWSSIEGITYPYDLTETGEPDASHYAAKVAYDYGVKVGGVGRLMTYSEATALETANSDILYGENGKSSTGGFYFWLGTASNEENTWFARSLGTIPPSHSVSNTDYSYNDMVMVRPVVEISKSSIL